MDAETILKLITGLLTLNGNILQIFVTLRDRDTWTRKAVSQLGSLGGTYKFIIRVPHTIYNILLWILLILSVVSVYAGVCTIYAKPILIMPGLFKWLFDNSILLGVIYSVVLLPVQLNLFSRFLLTGIAKIDYLLDTYNAQFNVGWINAKWQLFHYEPYFAMNINELNTRKIANTIIGLMKGGKGLEFEEKAIEPTGLSKDEKANYLLFKVAIERPINQLFPRGSGILRNSHKFLAAISESPESPFRPDRLTEYQKKPINGTFYQHLRSLNINGAVGSLPDEPFIDRVVQNTFQRLVMKYQGRGGLLSENIFHKHGSPKVLIRRLKKFPTLSEDYIRLYLKLSIRMRVWEKMHPGPFLFPYSGGIALLFLNSYCLETTSDVKRIEIDREFKSLIALVEEKIITHVYEYIQSSSTNPDIIKLTQSLLSVNPTDVNIWELSDLVDLWLWQYARKHCAKRNEAQTGQMLDCLLLTSGTDSRCYCDENSNLWELRGDVIVRK